MASSSPTAGSRRSLSRFCTLATGLGVVFVGAYVSWKIQPPSGTLTHRLGLAFGIGGSAWTLAAIFLPMGKLLRLLGLVSANVLILGLLLAAIETGGRVAKIDFAAKSHAHAEALRKTYPLWTREPDVPLPEVFFQHPGPFTWTGQPLRQLEVLRLGTDNAYANEPTITISYDEKGFRNPPELKHWDAVVVGDSYTELGYLKDDQMSSSVAAERTGLRLKNLGVCDTGLLAYSRYLKTFGADASCKQVVFVMFEGNDVQDTEAEHAALTRYQLFGEREYRTLSAQTSFVKAVTSAIRDSRNQPKPQSFQNAWFRSGNELLPISISVELPVDPKQMTGPQLMALKDGIRACSAQAQALGLRAGLVYVPVNNRVYHGMLRFGDQLPDEVRNWQPHDLPRFVAELCAQSGMAFADATPPMRAAAEQGHYVHNRILDCHVNAEGAAIIGGVIADMLSSTVKPAQVAAP